MKHTNLRYLLLLMAWLSIGAYAQTNRIYIPDLKMSKGSEKVLSVYMDNTEAVTAVEFTLELPSGFTLNPLSAILTDRAKNHQITARKLKNGKYKFVVMSQNNSLIEGIAGRLFNVRVQSPENATDDGDYPMAVSGAVMSAKSGSNILQASNGGKIIIKSMPNLHVISLDCSEPIAGQTVTVQWKVRNDGRGSTGDSSWKDYIWLVPNISAGTSMTGSKMLKAVENVSALAPGESYENTANVTLDERIYGNYDLVVTSNMYGANNIDFSQTGGEAPIPYTPLNADYGFLMAKGNASYVTVEEENEYDGESDNFFFKRINIQVPPLPDIQVTSVVAEVIPVPYLQTGGVVDSFESLYESMTPTPLTASGVAHSTAFFSGKKISVTATIANKGNADITGKSWKNALYLSTSEDVSEGEKLGLTSESVSNRTIKAGETTTVTFTSMIPYDWAGDTYFHVHADTDDEIYELANTANNWGHSNIVNILLTPGADFVPEELTVPSSVTAGGNISVSYRVKNQGPGIPYVSLWNDKIYLSSSDKGVDNTAVLLGSFERRGSFRSKTFISAPTSGGGPVLLPAEDFVYQGDNYSATYNVPVANLSSGTYYLYVVVDADDKVYEYDGESNNVIMSKAIQLSVTDLTAEIISISEETLSTDNQVAVAWRLKNVGNADIQNAAVKDGFYAATDANGSSSISLGTVTNTISIVAGGEKVLRTNITIPRNSSLNGTRYFFVKTNIDEQLKEANTTNNTSTKIAKQFVYVEDPANIKVNGTNLTVSALQVASSATPGESVTLSYKVKNTGSLAIDKEVKQEIFISKSSSFDSSAKSLAVVGSLTTINGLQADALATANVHITIPADMMGGQNYIYVVVNRDKVLAEKKYDDNEVKLPVYINGNLPNLIVANLIVPTSIMTSETTEVKWTLGNTGSWDTNNAQCTIYLSTDATLSSNDKELTYVRSGNLAKNSSEDMKATIELADDIVGEYYLIVKTNTSNAEETTTEDNVISQVFTSVQSPLPDLVISDLSSEGSWRTGQSVTIKANVKNVGDRDTRKDKWTDIFYLSEGYTLDINKAIKVGSKTHVGNLEKDGSYKISADFTIPSEAKGYYVLFAVADGTTALIEKDKDNNTTKETVYVEDPSDTPADLAITKLDAPVRIIAGEPVTISYNIANQGEYAANGKLRDVIYMSKNDSWDENDVMVGVVTGDVNIDAGTEISRSVTGRIINMPEGSYYIIVRTNSTHSIAESDYDNNQAIERSASAVAFQTLSLGQSVTVNTSGLYKLPMHSGLNGKTIGLYLSIPEDAAAGLYSAYNKVPSTARYDRSASNIETSEQELLIPDVQEGNYYILAQDNAAVSRSLNEFIIDDEQEPAVTYMQLSAREVQFGATNLSIKEGGNKGWISTEIHGALLDSIMDFRLARDGEMIPAESITFHNQTSSKATFNLNDAQTGSYDVVSELPNGTLATLPDGFKVVPGTNVALGVKIDGPKQTRVSGYGPVSVTYVNGGNTDIVIRELLLTIHGGQLSTTIEGLRNNPQTELHIHPDVNMDNRGFVVIPPGKQETVNYYFLQTASFTYLNLYIVK